MDSQCHPKFQRFYCLKELHTDLTTTGKEFSITWTWIFIRAARTRESNSQLWVVRCVPNRYHHTTLTCQTTEERHNIKGGIQSVRAIEILGRAVRSMGQ